MPQDSTIDIFYNFTEKMGNKQKDIGNREKVNINFINGKVINKNKLYDLNLTQYNHIVVLSDLEAGSIMEADSKNLIILLYIRIFSIAIK